MSDQATPQPIASKGAVWVTGARGMLGQAVVHSLAAQGLEATASGSEIDVSDPAAVKAFARQHSCGTWINCAAMTAVDACEDGAEGAQRNDAVNARAPGVLAQVARAHGARLVHVSTDYVFAGDAHEPYVEQDACAPKTAYGEAKLRGERAMWQALGPAADLGYVVRTAWLFGPTGQNFAATMLRLMRERPRLEVVDDQRGRPTYVPDLARALVQLVGLNAPASRKPAPGGTYHFSNAGEVSWHGFASAIYAEAQRRDLELTCREVAPTDSTRFVRPAPRPAYSVLDTAKVSRALGAAPRAFTAALSDYFDVLYPR